MTLLTVIKHVEQARAKLDTIDSKIRLSSEFKDSEDRLNQTLITLYRLRDGIPLTYELEPGYERRRH